MTNNDGQPPVLNLEEDFDSAGILSRMQDYLTRHGIADYQTEENEVPTRRDLTNTGQTLTDEPEETPSSLWDLDEIERQTRTNTSANLLRTRSAPQNPPALAEEEWDREAREAPAPPFQYGRGFYHYPLRPEWTTDAHYSPEVTRENRREWYRRVHKLGVNYPHHPQKRKTIRF